MKKLHLDTLTQWLMLAVLCALPLLAFGLDKPFLLTFSTRIIIFAIAACSLNLILGYGGMVSFGHSLYMGLGAYAVGILAHHQIDNGWWQLVAVLAGSGLIGFITGFISLRTSGIAFIMITLAFAQMFFYLFVSLKQYGGDDGLPVPQRSQFSGLSLGDGLTLYIVASVLLVAVVWFTARFVNARFGMVLRGVKDNEPRMQALGFFTLRYKLLAYVIASVIAGCAGLLYANLTGFVSPAYMAWTVSGELIVMVVLGGMGTVLGPVVGAAVLLIGEEYLQHLTEHWQMVLGVLIILIVLLAKRGLYGYALDAWQAWQTKRGGL